MTEPDELYHCWFYRGEEDPERCLFKCMANSTNHALWQLLDCEPTATGVSCVRADEDGPKERLPNAAAEKPKPTREEILAWRTIYRPIPPNNRCLGLTAVFRDAEGNEHTLSEVEELLREAE